MSENKHGFVQLTKQAFLIVGLPLSYQRYLHFLKVDIQLKKVVPVTRHLNFSAYGFSS